MRGKVALPPHPHPQKRRYAQTRAGRTAVQIQCSDFFGLTNYKAISLTTKSKDSSGLYSV